MSIQAIVTDIEGTTTDIHFVHQVLFPYAAKHIADYVRQHAAQLNQELAEVQSLAGQTLDLEGCISQLEQWIRADVKATPLKAIQGYIWQAGYQQGDFTGHLYADAQQYLQQWQQQGIALYVYSSGSVQAQKLLFGFSDFGDLTPLFSGYFDTHIGHKREVSSYQHIVQALAIPAANILFLSDIVAELDAASSAGMQCIQLVRNSNMDVGTHKQVNDFSQIDLESMA